MGHQPPQSVLLAAMGAVVADTGSESPTIVNTNIIIVVDAIAVSVGLCGCVSVCGCAWPHHKDGAEDEDPSKRFKSIIPRPSGASSSTASPSILGLHGLVVVSSTLVSVSVP
jgi:hypothetical protein